ncbi:NAD/NADP octopine/nopaline dehydrogenase family protein [Acinetobacter gerneri]|uniref:NAD/NADP octopine/nopaline dehydrogenase family protein n=1 Tax=Acinetobacter gerneri TaxID=202952 RepID=A0AAW8JHR3_9GAMM|nr:NAD/NADP octopine/nopaline dehydrogenase family protein [Acinetobacter gerneri]MDQ9010265.1 NAD/NADP octopine/nopaline dehydrogenase family protein [Acinetobacter gerneri]MDQ9014322.1 NAD/NADP octopine/nopaline dehydrogenase family protein [Acinetobacter gerneri]MDQ9025493.1 NAD/NADP octopine/nopaline dehydrogenase family protein [Acinetobacter gerneri]MDQ9052824.1 NAD/NADP octopine/nopaline dehydrogenase family protein [Acinetobacter gerneri]MDQ9060392.1 NAD/NADP octopine/nopaline dehydrog
MKITVLGGGHGCYAAAVEMAEKGHDVVLWRRDGEAFEALNQAAQLNVKDYQGTRSVTVGFENAQIILKTNLEQAIQHAELIIIPLPATTHTDLSKQTAPYFKDGQVVFLPPGTFGSFIFAKAMKDAGNNAKVAFAETGTLPYLVRKHGVNDIVVSGYATRLPTGVFPSALSEHAFKILKQAYPSVEAIEDGLSGALMNAGPVIHPPLIMMNAGPLEHFEAWDIHNEGTQPSIRRVTNQLDAERMRVREALGYGAPHFPLADHYNKEGEGDEWMYGRGAHGKLTDSGDWREDIDLEKHRYMLEDTRLGLSFLVSVGRFAGVKTPVAEGLLNIASAVTAKDLYAEGRTLEDLGLANLSKQQLKSLLNEGI